MLVDTAGCETPRAEAAPANEPAFATARRLCRRFWSRDVNKIYRKERYRYLTLCIDASQFANKPHRS